MTTVALYARYSTALQSQSSVEDQFHLLRQRAGQEGWDIALEAADRAISGTVRDRPGLADAMAAIEAGRATVLLAESLDRISRDQEDLANLFKRVRFAGASIVTLSEGTIGAIHIGMGGTMSALFLEQLAEKVRRGHIGRVNAGRIPGGLSYGYRAVREFDQRGELIRGLREVDHDQATIVLRIFTEYADGKSPVVIARELNAEGIPGPRGGLWRTNAITGHRQRRNGILHNELYRGRIVYNRQAFRKDPLTRKRVSRPNPESDLVVQDVPELAIVDDALWQRVQDRLAKHDGQPLHKTRRPKRLLSGFLRCGECGGSYTVVTQDRWGCSTHKQTGTCSNHVTITNGIVERRVLTALRRELLHPKVIAAFIEEARLAVAELRRDAIARRAERERRLTQLRTEQSNIADAIARGFPAETFLDRARAIITEQQSIELDLAELPELPAAIDHPGRADFYRLQVEQLHEAIGDDPGVTADLRRLLEVLVDRIAVNPRADGKRGADLTLHGDLAALLSIDTKKPPRTDVPGGDCTASVVAGARFGQWRTIAIAA